MKLSLFDFSLPQELIAQNPLPQRDASRMMVVYRNEARWEHRLFTDLPEILTSDQFLVVNSTRVFPARLRATAPGVTRQIEILLTRELDPGIWSALVKPARKVASGQILEAGELRAEVMGSLESGERILRFQASDQLDALLERGGETPLPPYIRRQNAASDPVDRERYQTIFARQRGSIAAPTAALHFTPDTLTRLEAKGVERCEILLHVGYGTFKPVRCEDIEHHRIDPEYYCVTATAAEGIRMRKQLGRRLIAVGTTTTRILEFLAAGEGIQAGSGWCDLFIFPGFRFRILDGLLTNFHLPRSSLFILAAAWAGLDLLQACYREAVAERYRFYSYGDCMLIL